MISIKDLEELLEKNERLIASMDESKKRRVNELSKELKKSLKRYATLEAEVDNEENPPADFSAALTNLRELEKKIVQMETDLRKLLGGTESSPRIRETSDIGTVGGNGAVVFRAQGGRFIVPEGSLTQDTLVRLQKCMEAKGKNFKEELKKRGDVYRDCLNSINQDIKKTK